MPDYGWKIALILAVTLSARFTVFYGWPPKLGVDLGGGAHAGLPGGPGEDASGQLDKDTMDS